MRIDVLGVGFDDLTMAEAVDRAMELVRGAGTHYVATPNPEIVRSAGRILRPGPPSTARTWCCRTASASSRARPCWERL